MQKNNGIAAAPIDVSYLPRTNAGELLRLRERLHGALVRLGCNFFSIPNEETCSIRSKNPHRTNREHDHSRQITCPSHGSPVRSELRDLKKIIKKFDRVFPHEVIDHERCRWPQHG